MLFSDVFIKITGSAHCQWSEDEEYRDHEHNSRTRSVTYSGDESYLNEKTYLIGGESGELLLRSK